MADVSDFVKDSIFEVLWFKNKEFVDFNAKIAQCLKDIFDKLLPYFSREEKALILRLGK
jgi:hypothetical protein